MSKEQLVVSLRDTSPATPSAAVPPERQPKKRGNPKNLIIGIAFLLIVGVVGWNLSATNGSSTGKQNSSTPALGANGGATSPQGVKSADIIAKIGMLIELPQGETPTVATVTDPSKLTDQPFFAKAKAGDIVLIYTAAREAYLYDPVQNKLVTVAPITTNAATATSSGMSAGHQ
jgi:hypothetical protein